MAYQMAATGVTLNDLQGQSLVAGIFKCNPSNICAAFYSISTDSVLARFLCISLSELLVEIHEYYNFCFVTFSQLYEVCNKNSVIVQITLPSAIYPFQSNIQCCETLQLVGTEVLVAPPPKKPTLSALRASLLGASCSCPCSLKSTTASTIVWYSVILQDHPKSRTVDKRNQRLS